MIIRICIPTWNRVEMTLNSFKKVYDDARIDTIVIVDDVETIIIEDKSLTYLGLVHLGFIQTKDGKYDEQGNETKAPTFSDMYSVDVFWKTDEPDTWKGKKIKLNGRKNSHSFASEKPYYIYTHVDEI